MACQAPWVLGFEAVIPALFIAFALRFTASQSLAKEPSLRKAFELTYFIFIREMNSDIHCLWELVFMPQQNVIDENFFLQAFRASPVWQTCPLLTLWRISGMHGIKWIELNECLPIER
jgi:hypothetical protein